MRQNRARSCTYLVPLDASATEADLQSLAPYLSEMDMAGCEVITIDPAPQAALEARSRILRWVSRHIAADGDLLQIAIDHAGSEKIIVASPESRYTVLEVATICSLLEQNEVVEPGEFVDPLPWWGVLDAGQILLQRGLDQPAARGRTFAFRSAAWRPLRGLEERTEEDPVGRLRTHGAEVHQARDLFVRREPPKRASIWARLRAREASSASTVALHSAFLACLIPMLVILGVAGGAELAGGYAGVIAFASVLVAIRGRGGAARYFPWRICLFAPMTIVERSLTVYWSLFARLRTVRALPSRRHAPTDNTSAPRLARSSPRRV